MGSRNNPGKFDCLAAAEPDEPTFTLLGRDPCAAATVAFWCMLRDNVRNNPADASQLKEASECEDAMEQWAMKLGKADEVEKAMIIMATIYAALDPKATPPDGPGDLPTNGAAEEVTQF